MAFVGWREIHLVYVRKGFVNLANQFVKVIGTLIFDASNDDPPWKTW